MEQICKLMPITLSPNHDPVTNRAVRPLAPAKHDEEIKAEVRQVFEMNFQVYTVPRSGDSSNGKELEVPNKGAHCGQYNGYRHKSEGN